MVNSILTKEIAQVAMIVLRNRDDHLFVLFGGHIVVQICPYATDSGLKELL